MVSELSEQEIDNYQNEIIKIPDNVVIEKIESLRKELSVLETRLGSTSNPSINKNPKSLLYEYIQKNKLEPVKFIHTFNEYNRIFQTTCWFNNIKFEGFGASKKAAETVIASDILRYIDTQFSIKKYQAPEEYTELMLIDLENFTALPLEILKNYSKYRIVGYLAFNHALVAKLDNIERYMEMKLVQCSDKDAVDIMMTIDIARYQGQVSKIYLLTGDHFGKTVAKFLDYCECIDDYKYLLTHNNHLL